MSRLVGGDTAGDAFLARSKAMGHETYINRRSALKGIDVYLDQIGSAGGVGSPREHEVMGLMVAGLLNKQIAAELGTALATIKIQRAGLRLS